MAVAATGMTARRATSTPRSADRATEAALEMTGGGTANSVESDNENGATYEVEVIKPNGDTVDVRIDEIVQVVVIESDSEGAVGRRTNVTAWISTVWT